MNLLYKSPKFWYISNDFLHFPLIFPLGEGERGVRATSKTLPIHITNRPVEITFPEKIGDQKIDDSMPNSSSVFTRQHIWLVRVGY